MTNYDYMLIAKQASSVSNCQRRKIGVVFKVGTLTFPGTNNAPELCSSCTREIGECRAIHAEVDALLNAKSYAQFGDTDLFIWAEVPCSSCLSTINRITLGHCVRIHCLTVKSYGLEYPRVLANYEAVLKRVQFAHELGITIHLYDRKKLLKIMED